MTKGARERVAAAVREVLDPELPHVTLGDLGIVRSVEIEGSVVNVVLTPTFVGCPAMEQIRDDVEEVVRGMGYGADIVISMSPAWSTDWISEAGRRKLAAAGIAPPPSVGVHGNGAGDDFLVALDLPVACPRCGSKATRRLSDFGATACKAPYKCTECLEPFEGFKPL